MKRNKSIKGKQNSEYETEHEMWKLFWSYEIPRMEARLNRKQIPPLPKDEFELETYKICEMKFKNDKYHSNRLEWSSLSKFAS